MALGRGQIRMALAQVLAFEV